MRTLLMFAAIVVGALMVFMGGAALFFPGGGGVGGAVRDLVRGMPGGEEIWRSPLIGIVGGVAVGLFGLWMSRS